MHLLHNFTFQLSNYIIHSDLKVKSGGGGSNKILKLNSLADSIITVMILSQNPILKKNTDIVFSHKLDFFLLFNIFISFYSMSTVQLCNIYTNPYKIPDIIPNPLKNVKPFRKGRLKWN